MNTYANGNSATNLSHLLQQALALHQQGKLEKAEELYNAILAVNPNHPQALHYLGVIFDVNGDHLKAIELIEKSITINPNDPEAFNNLGLAYKGKEEWLKAVQYYKHAIKLDPNYPEAIYNLGIALHHAEMYKEAVDFFNQALKLAPNYAEVYCSMGRTYGTVGESLKEIECCRKAIAIKPDFPEAYINMGVAYATLDDMAEAETCFRKAVEINPNRTNALFNLSIMLEEQGKTQEAETIYRTVLATQPDFYAALHNFSSILQQQGKVEEARAHYEKAIATGKRPAIRVKLALLTRPIHSTTSDTLSERNQLTAAIDTLRRENFTVHDAYMEVGTVNFYHAFHGLNNRDLNRNICDFFYKACPSLGWRAPHVDTPWNDKHPIRIGILSHFWREHTITKFMHGIVEKLPRDRFEVVLISVQGAEDFMTHAIKSVADYVITVPKDLTKAREEIAQHALDILFYPDIGMEAFTSFLSYSKLARVQCVTWGHPDTSGEASIDYFISQKDIETPGSQEAYSEQLICLNELPTYYYPPAPPTEPKDRAFYNLPEQGNLYLCPQTLFKFHPDFDPVLAEILRRDKNGFLVLIDGNQKYWNTLLKERFEKTIPDVLGRIHFVRRISRDNFLSLCMLAHAVLDPIHFGGGNTSYECFSLGVPIVTLPGEFMRGRVTYGCYTKMGMTDLVATDTAQYIDMALKLANNPTFRKQMQDKIKQTSTVLYKNDAAIEEMSAFFEQAMQAQATGRKITSWPL